jgi:hypothetical protein
MVAFGGVLSAAGVSDRNGVLTQILYHSGA